MGMFSPQRSDKWRRDGLCLAIWGYSGAHSIWNLVVLEQDHLQAALEKGAYKTWACGAEHEREIGGLVFVCLRDHDGHRSLCKLVLRGCCLWGHLSVDLRHVLSLIYIEYRRVFFYLETASSKEVFLR